MIVYVETNFLLELALEQEQHASCEALLQLAERKAITLAIPAFSVVEAWATLRRTIREREKLQGLLNSHVHEFKRTQSLSRMEKEAIAKVVDALILNTQTAESRFEQFETRLSRIARFLSLDASVAVGLSVYVNDYSLEPPDAAILASVVMDAQFGKGPSCFLNRNTKDFGQPPIKEMLGKNDCRLITRFDDGLSYVQSSLKQAKP